MPVKPLIVCITGLPGSGKTTVAEALRELGFSVISMGDVVRNEARKRGLELNDSNLGKVMLELRNKYGTDAIAVYIGEIIKDSNSDSRYYAIDGLRSIGEADRLREYGYVKILAIHAPKERRFDLLVKRGRSDAPLSMQEFLARDRRELDVGIGEAIVYSDEIISNNGSREELIDKALSVVKYWIDEYLSDKYE